MPLRHRLQDGVIWITTEGDVEYDEGIASLGRALEAAKQADPVARWDIVFDVRRSSENRSADELRRIAQLVAENGSVLSGRTVVIAGDDLHYGLSRMFQAYCELHGLRAAVRRDPDAALAWLRETAAGEAGRETGMD